MVRLDVFTYAARAAWGEVTLWVLPPYAERQPGDVGARPKAGPGAADGTPVLMITLGLLLFCRQC